MLKYLNPFRIKSKIIAKNSYKVQQHTIFKDCKFLVSVTPSLLKNSKIIKI